MGDADEFVSDSGDVGELCGDDGEAIITIGLLSCGAAKWVAESGVKYFCVDGRHRRACSRSSGVLIM